MRRFEIPSRTTSRVVMGAIALDLMRAAEFALVLPLRGLTIVKSFATRDPVSATYYYASLSTAPPYAPSVPGSRPPSPSAVESRGRIYWKAN